MHASGDERAALLRAAVLSALDQRFGGGEVRLEASAYLAVGVAPRALPPLFVGPAGFAAVSGHWAGPFFAPGARRAKGDAALDFLQERSRGGEARGEEARGEEARREAASREERRREEEARREESGEKRRHPLPSSSCSSPAPSPARSASARSRSTPRRTRCPRPPPLLRGAPAPAAASAAASRRPQLSHTRRTRATRLLSAR